MKKIDKIRSILNKMEMQITTKKDKNSQIISKITELKEIYPTEKICELVDQFLVPEYDKNNLENYLRCELERYNALASLMPGYLEPVEVTDEEFNLFQSHLIEIIKILKK